MLALTSLVEILTSFHRLAPFSYLVHLLWNPHHSTTSLRILAPLSYLAYLWWNTHIAPQCCFESSLRYVAHLWWNTHIAPQSRFESTLRSTTLQISGGILTSLQNLATNPGSAQLPCTYLVENSHSFTTSPRTLAPLSYLAHLW
ncbi:jg9816 [Pararge aegeria aegeria]|uniref:Jg9816 protein n=1 Tax=Pararge aegeria aegeria TaxID=348720 RepID=A0A8S4RII6_9NEOP|nr:jg9816 [Pararge aegeria aegeria]